MPNPNPLSANEQIVIESDPKDAKNLRELVLAIRPENGRWDMLACTDGSGSTIASPGGYAAVLVDRRKAEISLITGSASNCSSQGAEVRAVFELANFLVTRKSGDRQGGYCVLLVTDSVYVASSLKSINDDPVRAIQMKSHRMQWIAIQYAARMGIRFVPTHIGRNSNPLMTLADNASRAARLMVSQEQLIDLLSQTEKECEETFQLTSK